MIEAGLPTAAGRAVAGWHEAPRGGCRVPDGRFYGQNTEGEMLGAFIYIVDKKD